MASAEAAAVSVDALAGAMLEAEVFKKCTPKGKLQDMHIRLTRRESVLKAIVKVIAMPHISQMLDNFKALDETLMFKKRLVFAAMKRVGGTMKVSKTELNVWARGETAKLIPLLAVARHLQSFAIIFLF